MTEAHEAPDRDTAERDTAEREASPSATHRALIRYGGDLTTKAPATRRRFTQRLARNLRDALDSENVRARLDRTHDRIFVESDATPPLPVLARVFGVQSASLAEQRPCATLDDALLAGRQIFSEAVRGRRFAVRARRVGDRSRIPIDARALERALGAELLPHATGVDLERPEVTAHIELMPGRACFFRDTTRGPGGLPLGVEGHAVALVSGGFDSAVAAWLMMKRGVALDFVFCNLGGRSHQVGTLRVMKLVADRWSYGTRPHMHALDFDAISRNLRDCCQPRYWQVVLKRLMLRAAERVAREREATAIVTGDAVGQVSSQTLQNLAAISDATPLPILRPLVGFNKDEIVALARQIGTHDLSKVVGEYCAMVPSKPATSASLEVARAQHERLDASLLELAVAERSAFDLRRLDLEKVDEPGLAVDEIPEGATVLDLRSKAAFRAWHHPGALYLDFASALRTHASFDRSQTYVLYCEFGLKSAHLAELMRRQGLEAFHLQQGLKDAVRLARKRGFDTPDPLP